MSKPQLTNVSVDQQRSEELASKRDELLRRLLDTPPQPQPHPADEKPCKEDDHGS